MRCARSLLGVFNGPRAIWGRIIGTPHVTAGWARVGSTRNPLLLPYVSDQGGARTLSPTLLVFTYKNRALLHMPS